MKRTDVVTADPITLRTNLPELEALFTQAPRVAAFHVRDLIGRWFGSHYRAWRRTLKPWQRRMADRGAYQYKIQPAPGARSAERLHQLLRRYSTLSLDRIYGRGTIRSAVVLAHELGMVVKPTRGRFLRIPVGKGRREFSGKGRAARFLEARPDIFVRHRGPKITLVRKTGQKTAKGKDRVETLFVLARQVTIQASLGVVRTWKEQEPERTLRQQQAADAIVAELHGMTEGVANAG